MKFVLVLLVINLTLGFAQIPKRCTTPKAWEARSIGIDYQKDVYLSGKFYYDAENNRTAYVYEEYEDGQEIEYERVYNFHKEKAKYIYDARTRTCKVYPLTEPFETIGIPANARFLDTYVIGTNAEEKYGLTVNLWEQVLRVDTRVTMEYVAYDGDNDENCYPVSLTAFSPSNVYHESYYNIVAGYNPDHFLPPEDCVKLSKP